jgi:hypothetical protein
VLGQLLSDAELVGTLSPAAAQKVRHANQHHQKEGKKLRTAFSYAVGAGVLTASEADELAELLNYRNDIAQCIHLVMIRRDPIILDVRACRVHGARICRLSAV